MAIAPPKAKAARTIAMISAVFMLSPAAMSGCVRVPFDLDPILRVGMRAGIWAVAGTVENPTIAPRLPEHHLEDIWVALIALNRDGLLTPEDPKLKFILRGGNHDSRDRGHREDER